jgi:hypothetical protein
MKRYKKLQWKAIEKSNKKEHKTKQKRIANVDKKEQKVQINRKQKQRKM